jgi:hypothetical protein
MTRVSEHTTRSLYDYPVHVLNVLSEAHSSQKRSYADWHVHSCEKFASSVKATSRKRLSYYKICVLVYAPNCDGLSFLSRN